MNLGQHAAHAAPGRVLNHVDIRNNQPAVVFEALTLKQTRKIHDFPVILFGSDFWDGLMRWLATLGIAALMLLTVALPWTPIGRRGVEQATETLQVERERHDAGRITTNDLLDAESELRRQRTRHEVARLDVVRARIRLGLALGRPTGSALLGP